MKDSTPRDDVHSFKHQSLIHEACLSLSSVEASSIYEQKSPAEKLRSAEGVESGKRHITD
jgi:hypothetical protein